MFTGSIKDNILVGKENATDEEINKVLIASHLDEFVAGLENGVDTLIGENGCSLSGGQMQRLAIARAMVKDSPIVILDRDHCIAAAGISKKEVLERRVTQQAEELLDRRVKYICNDSNENIYPLEGVDKLASVFVPIIANGDLTGAVVMLKDSSTDKCSETDEKICTLTANFLAKQTEE